MKLHFVAESKEDDREIRENIKNKIRDCLKAINPGYDANESSAYSEFIELYYIYEKDNQLQLKNPNPEILLE
jgi:hypothetical protein